MKNQQTLVLTNKKQRSFLWWLFATCGEKKSGNNICKVFFLNKKWAQVLTSWGKISVKVPYSDNRLQPVMGVQLLLLTSFTSDQIWVSPIVEDRQLTDFTGYPKLTLGHDNDNEIHSGEYLRKILNTPKEMNAVTSTFVWLHSFPFAYWIFSALWASK
jgi:hypothetical protein